MVFRDASELRQPLAKEAVAVLTAVDVGVADHVRVIVRNRQMSVNSVVFLNVNVDRILVGTQNHRLITSGGNLFVHLLKIFSNQKFNSSV